MLPNKVVPSRIKRDHVRVVLGLFADAFVSRVKRRMDIRIVRMSKNRYSVIANYTTNLIYDRLGPVLTEQLIRKSPKNDSGYRPNRLHQWLSVIAHLGHGWRAEVAEMTVVDAVLGG